MTVEAFCPIATYTQIRSLPLELMMVSIATAVLPVWRSPMMSSRWPRPMGTIASMDLRPVWSGCVTDLRAMTPGATFSMMSRSLDSIAPLPSIGLPSASTTRPMSAVPTGTSRMRPVVLTVSPSEMWRYSPRITVPTESRSRFSARPNVWSLNSRISPCITSESPWTRQMPSVTVTTVPWVRTSVATPRPWMRFFSSSLISDGLSCMEPPRKRKSGRQLVLHRIEARTNRAVKHAITDRHPHAANEVGIEPDFGLELKGEFLGKRGEQARHLVAAHGKGTFDHAGGYAIGRVPEGTELACHFGQGCQAAVLQDKPQQLSHRGWHGLSPKRGDEFVAVCIR